MAEPRRSPLLATAAALLVAGALWGQGSPEGSSATRSTGGGPASEAPVSALSSSWSCAGATEYPGSVASGSLLISNASRAPVPVLVQLVSQQGYRRSEALKVAAGSVTVLPEQLPGVGGSRSNHWLGAFVTVYGGMAMVSQAVTTVRGSSSQPCASSAAKAWYFPEGATLRNAWDEISLLDPYPQPAIADLSFTTEQGREQPMDFQGVVVPARGLTVVDLGSHLRRRQHIAVTVTARTGEVVAFQTQIVAAPPAGAPPRGGPGANNPVVPVPGTTLMLGADHASGSLWWPTGGEGPGMTESYAVYNPAPAPVRLELDLDGGGGARSSETLSLPPYGSSFITTNGAPWALPGAAYSAHLSTVNGGAVVAERFIMMAPPAAGRGLAALLGQSAGARQWLVAPGPGALAQSPRRASLLHTALRLLDPGPAAAVVSVRVALGGAVPATAVPATAVPASAVPASAVPATGPGPGAASAAAAVPGLESLHLAPGSSQPVAVPAGLQGRPLLVESSVNILLEQDWTSSLQSLGGGLAPAAGLTLP